MQPDDYGHWLEVVVAALVGIGGWLWRLGRKEQQQEDRIAWLEQWRAAVTEEIKTDIGRMEDRLDRIESEQTKQAATLARIEGNQEHQREHMRELREDLRILMGERRDGGDRRYDPPRRQET